MIDPEQYRKQLDREREFAEEVIDFIQEQCDGDIESGAMVAAITYCAISVANKETIHKAIERIMTIHKNTFLVEGDEE